MSTKENQIAALAAISRSALALKQCIEEDDDNRAGYEEADLLNALRSFGYEVQIVHPDQQKRV